MHNSKICIVKPGPKMRICEICIVMPCLRPILRGNKTCNQKQNLQQVLYFPVLAWKILFTKLAASFVGLHVSTKLALVLQHRLTTNSFVCQHLQHYRRLMLSLALSCHTPSSLIICSSPCLAHHRHAGGRNQRFVESNHQKEMQSKQCSSDLWICLKTLQIISLAWRHRACIFPHWNLVRSPDPACFFALKHDVDRTGLSNSQLTRNGLELLASSNSCPSPSKIQLLWRGNCSGASIRRLANVHSRHWIQSQTLPTVGGQCCHGNRHYESWCGVVAQKDMGKVVQSQPVQRCILVGYWR